MRLHACRGKIAQDINMLMNSTKLPGSDLRGRVPADALLVGLIPRQLSHPHLAQTGNYFQSH